MLAESKGEEAEKSRNEIGDAGSNSKSAQSSKALKIMNFSAKVDFHSETRGNVENAKNRSIASRYSRKLLLATSPVVKFKVARYRIDKSKSYNGPMRQPTLGGYGEVCSYAGGVDASLFTASCGGSGGPTFRLCCALV